MIDKVNTTADMKLKPNIKISGLIASKFMLILFLAGFQFIQSCSNNSQSLSAADSTKSLVFPPQAIVDKLPFYQQIMNQWCWAACGQICMAHYGQNITQCLQVGNSVGSKDCCSTSCSLDCALAKNLPDISGWPKFDLYHFNVCTSDSPLPWDTIKYQIGILQRPIVYAYHNYYSTGTGHVVVIAGYIEAPDGNRSLEFYDPLNDSAEFSTKTYQDYFSGRDAHWRDYYNISKQ